MLLDVQFERVAPFRLKRAKKGAINLRHGHLLMDRLLSGCWWSQCAISSAGRSICSHSSVYI